MIRSRTERLLAADGQSPSIHEVTEELPTLRGIGQDLVTKVIVGLTSWDDRAFETFLLRDIVDLRTSGHTARETFDAGLEVGDRLLSPVGDDSDTVTGSDECALAVDHVPVAVTVAGRTKLDVVALDTLYECVRVREVGVRVT